VGHASRSSGLFRVEARLARVSQFDLKTGGGVMADGCIEDKLKTDGSMRRATSDPANLTLPFSLY
jgi:hypothetical protein